MAAPTVAATARTAGEAAQQLLGTTLPAGALLANSSIGAPASANVEQAKFYFAPGPGILGSSQRAVSPQPQVIVAGGAPSAILGVTQPAVVRPPVIETVAAPQSSPQPSSPQSAHPHAWEAVAGTQQADAKPAQFMVTPPMPAMQTLRPIGMVPTAVRSVSPMPTRGVVTTVPAPMLTPSLSSSSFPKYAGPPPVVVQQVPSAPMVPVPSNVLTHIDSVVSDMERELSAIQAAELAEVHAVRDNHLAQLRRILAEDLLKGREQEMEIEQSRLNVLEADHMAVKKQVLELEGQRYRVELERNELLRVRAALEEECMNRLEELQSVAKNAEGLSVQLNLEKEAHLAAENDLGTVKNELREMVKSCRALEEKVLNQDVELADLRNRALEVERLRELVAERDGQLATIHREQALVLMRDGDSADALTAQLLAEKELKEAHAMKVKEAEEKIRDFMEQIQRHEGSHSNKDLRIKQLEALMEESKDSEQKHLDTHQTHKKKISELEAKLSSLESQGGGNSAELARHKSTISRLEQELADVMAERDGHGQKIGHNQNQISIYEQQLEDLKLGDEKHHRQHSQNRSRLQELENVISEHEGTISSHEREKMQFRSSKQDLQQQVDQLTSERDTFSRQLKEKDRRIQALTEELHESGFSQADKSRMEKSHRASLKALEDQLADAEALSDRHSHESRTHRQKIGELEDQLAILRSSEDSSQLHARRASDLQQEVNDQQRKNMELSARVQQLEMRERVDQKELEDARRRLQEIDDVRSEIVTSRAELEMNKAAADEVRRNAESSVQAQEVLMLNKEREFRAQQQEHEARYRKLQAEFQGVEQELQASRLEIARLKRASMEAETRASLRTIASEEVPAKSPSQSSIRSFGSMASTRKSVFAFENVGRRHDNHMWGEFMPGNSDPFVGKIRNVMKLVSENLKSASQVHHRCLTAQIQLMIDAGSTRAFADYAHASEVDAERRSVKESVEATTHDLKAYHEELALQHHFTEEERRQVDERLELELERCDFEIELLESDSPLESVPQKVLSMLLDFHQTGPDAAWPDGHSPMHWAAHNGRHDIIEYLLNNGGEDLLRGHDKHGHSVLYYSQQGKHKALGHWLSQEHGLASHPVHQAPKTQQFDLPPTYMKVLEQIQTFGWRSMSWKEGFTMLHWAAKQGHGDLCRALVQYDADPSSADSHDRTPIDIARAHGHEEVVPILQDLRAQRRKSMAPRRR